MLLGLSWVLQLQVIVLLKSDFTGLLVQAESEIVLFSLNVVTTSALFLNTSVVAVLSVW